MAFQTGSSTSIENLLTQLSTFLQANGFTQDFFTSGDPGRMGLSKNGIFVAFQWTEATDNGTLAIYQNTSNDDATNVWLSTGDSGSGWASNTPSLFDLSRCVNVFAGPHSAYWFFENDSNPAYCHIVVEVDAGRYRHFGFGEIDKIGTFTGGEYCYGHHWNQQNNLIDVPSTQSHAIGLEGASTAGQGYQGTIRIEGYTGEPDPSTVWGATGYGASSAAGNDRAGNPRYPIGGPWRYTREFQHLSAVRISLLNAFKPLVPMPFEAKDFSGTPVRARRIGYQADVRMCNIGNLNPAQIINIAGDNWYFFPWVRKQFLANDTEESRNAGVAYRRIDA